MKWYPNHKGGWIRNAALVTTLPGLFISGCTTHYRESLADYRAAEPSPFYQRTLEWVDSQDKAPSARDTAPPSESPETVADPLQEPDTTDRATIIAARILNVTPELFTREAAPLKDDAAQKSALTDKLEWREVMLVVVLQNPRVRAAENEWDATLKQYSQADFLEGLLQEYKGFTKFLGVGAGAPLQKDMMQQFFPYPSAITYKGEMIREQVRLAELAWEKVLRNTLVEAGTTFFGYLFQYQGAETVAENVKLLENLVHVVQDRYAAGIASQPDVLRLQTELERQKKLLQDFEARTRSTASELNAMFGRPADAPLGRPVTRDVLYHAPAMNGLVENALQHRQEVLEQEARISRTEIAIRMGEIMSRPLFSQGYSTLDRGMIPDASTGSPNSPFGVQPDAPLPRPAYAQAEAYLAEMRQRLESAKATLQQIRLDTQTLARTTLEKADIAHRQTILIHDTVLPLAQSTYDITLRAYTVGEMNFLDLLDAERKLLETRLELDKSRLERNQAVLQIANVRGYFKDSE